MLKNKVAKNAVWIIGARLFQSVFALVINFLTARYLGPSNFGVINYAASLVALVVPIMNLGINNILVNELIVSPEEEGEILGTSIALTMFSSLCCIGGLAAFVAVANYGESETLIVCVLYSLLLICQSMELVQYWFQSKYMSKYTAISTLIAYLFISAYKLYILFTEKSIYWFAVSHAIDYLLIAVLLLFIYFRKGGQRFSFSVKVARRLLHTGKHYIIAGVMGTVLAQTDKIMLKILNGNEEVGLYSAAFAVAGMTSFVFAAIIDSMRPLVLEKYGKQKEEYEDCVALLYGVVIYLALLQCIVLTVFSRLVIIILYGEEFLGAVTTLRIVVWYTTFTYIGTVRSVWILAEKMQKYLWIISLSGMLLNVALNFVFIPIWGINGAALATLITQMFSNYIICYFIKPMRGNNALLMRGLNVKKIIKLVRNIK